MRNRTSYYIGLILIIIGGAALYNAVFLDNLFSMRNMWPLFILLPGLFLEIDYFTNYRRRDAGVLIPGGLLTLIGTYFLIRQFLPIMDSLSGPIFMVILGLALLQYYVAKPKDRGLLVISLALILIGAFIGYGRYLGEFPYWLNFDTVRALAILLFGVYLVFRTTGRDRKPDSTYRPKETYRKEASVSKDEVIYDRDKAPGEEKKPE
ncbi:MAG: hypothetical protein EOM07_07245 [Clostridia bacterium]|nr:hypothetical protein [Clostridia bacterium]